MKKTRPASTLHSRLAEDGSFRPALYIGERRITAIHSQTYPEQMHEFNAQLARTGVDAFILIVRGGFNGDRLASWFWRDDGVYGDDRDRPDGISLDRQAEEILKVCPDAAFMVRWRSEVPHAWAEKHLDQCQQGENVQRHDASYASMLALDGRVRMARQIVRFVESRPWADRVVGYLPFGQDEGTPALVNEDALFDICPAMQQAFRSFVQRKYPDHAALRKAWKDPEAALDTVRVPTDSEWRVARRGWLHWPPAGDGQRFRDYFLTCRELLHLQRRTELAAVHAAATRPTFAATDAVKQPMFGWILRDAFAARGWGMGHYNMFLGGGSFDTGSLLDSPELDALITPADYTARSIGFGYEPEGIGDSMVLRGKTILVEDDFRSWATEHGDTQGAWRTPAECRSGLLRNLAVAASRGFIPYTMCIGRGSFFNDDRILRIVSDQLPVRQTLLSRPLVHTEDAIAVILDDEASLHEDFTAGFQQLAVVRQRNDHLSMTGLPWRFFLLSDLKKDNFPIFRAYLLPTCFRLDPWKTALIREKLMRNGSVLIFGPGTGVVDADASGGAAASELLGFQLEREDREAARRVLVHGGAHPAVDGIQGSLTYGDSYIYGPILKPATDLGDAVELGKGSIYFLINRAGLVLREFGRGAAGNGQAGTRGAGDCAVVFSMAVPLPAPLLRSLAIFGGCTPWSDCGDVVAANGNMLAVHTVRPGRRELQLPAQAYVRDAVSGAVMAAAADRFECEFESPDTRVFLYDPIKEDACDTRD